MVDVAGYGRTNGNRRVSRALQRESTGEDIQVLAGSACTVTSIQTDIGHTELFRTGVGCSQNVAAIIRNHLDTRINIPCIYSGHASCTGNCVNRINDNCTILRLVTGQSDRSSRYTVDVDVTIAASC